MVRSNKKKKILKTWLCPLELFFHPLVFDSYLWLSTVGSVGKKTSEPPENMKEVSMLCWYVK